MNEDSFDIARNVSIAEQMKKIPQGSEYHAHKYETDNTHVIHLWDNNGNSFDLYVLKEEPSLTDEKAIKEYAKKTFREVNNLE